MRLSRNLKRAAALALAIGGFAVAPSTAAAAGPVLVVSDGGFGDYYPEILRAEGLNAFDVDEHRRPHRRGRSRRMTSSCSRRRT